jgi:4-hydroxyphenylpyruvate dioxygenase
MNVHAIAAVELWVGNARQATSYFVNAFGFSLTACDRSVGDRVSYQIRQGSVRLILTGATVRDSPVAEFVRDHGDGVRDVRFAVRGGDGDVISAFGDTVHSLVDDARAGDGPGAEHSGADGAAGAGIVAVDHVAVSVDAGERERCVARYEEELGFERFGAAIERIDVGGSAFQMSSVRSRAGDATLVFTEPADGQSQIADFLAENHGPGVHHLAFATDDIVRTAATLRARHVRTLPIADAYYPPARERVGDEALPWDALEELGILVDRDQDGLLLQAFTDPIGDRPTLYFEIIQRIGATGFGSDNVKALYHAVSQRAGD